MENKNWDGPSRNTKQKVYQGPYNQGNKKHEEFNNREYGSRDQDDGYGK